MKPLATRKFVEQKIEFITDEIFNSVETNNMNKYSSISTFHCWKKIFVQKWILQGFSIRCFRRLTKHKHYFNTLKLIERYEKRFSSGNLTKKWRSHTPQHLFYVPRISWKAMGIHNTSVCTENVFDLAREFNFYLGYIKSIPANVVLLPFTLVFDKPSLQKFFQG